MIITDEKILREPSEPVKTYAEAQEIIEKLEEESASIGYGIGLSAPQIGIKKQVAIIRMDNFMCNIINPVNIILENDHFIFEGEGCLSFPGIFYTTKRSTGITWTNGIPDQARLKADIKNRKRIVVVACQHEIDHLFGRLFFDYKVEPVDAGKNEPCPCGSGRKYKKCCGK